MADPLLDLLGYVGSSLDKPGRAVRGILGGRPQEALAALPFSDTLGITDPSNAVSGRGLLEQLGALSPKEEGEGFGLGDLAGMGVSMATDPLTYLGGLGASKLLGHLMGGAAGEAGDVAAQALRPASFAAEGADAANAVRPMTSRMVDLGKHPMEVVTNPTPEVLRTWAKNKALRGFIDDEGAHVWDDANGLHSLTARAMGKDIPDYNDSFRIENGKIGLYNNEEGSARAEAWARSTGLPLYGDKPASLGAPTAAAPPELGTSSGSNIPALLGPRRNITIVKDVGGPSWSGRAVGGYASPMETRQAAMDLLQAGKGRMGEFDPETAIGAVKATASPTTTRHEAIHGIISDASKSGMTQDLPMMMRLPANLMSGAGDTGLRRGLASVLDELAAQTLEHRTLGGKLGGALNFLFDNPLNDAQNAIHQNYAQHFAQHSPLVGSLYRGLNLAPTVAIPTATAGGGVYGLYRSLQGE
jgi:hypothetical protein